MTREQQYQRAHKLYYLHTKEKVTQEVLAKLYNMDQSAVSRAVKRVQAEVDERARQWKIMEDELREKEGI